MTMYPISLGWIKIAWQLYRQHLGLWVWSAFVPTITLFFTILLITAHFHPIIPIILSLGWLPTFFKQPSIPLIALVLIFFSLAANTAMTAMASRVVRGEAISLRDLFQYRNFGIISLALVTTLLAVLAGSLIFFVGSFIAAGLLLPAQATGLRTGKFGTALRLSAAFMRADPVRTLCLGGFFLLVGVVNILTGGLGLLVAVPMMKIVGALADVALEAYPVKEVLSPPTTGLVPTVAPFRWTPEEQVMLQRNVPQPRMSHALMFLLVGALSVSLLLSILPAGIASWISPLKPAQTASEASTFLQLAPSTPLYQDLSPPLPKPTAIAEPVLVRAYNAVSSPDLPCQMHWGDYTVRIEKIGSEDSLNKRQERVSVFDRTGSLVYTVTNEYIGLVKPEPLLGDEQPELLIHTGEGADGSTCMDLALSQEGGVHDIFVLHDAVRVRALLVSHRAVKEIVVDTGLDGPSHEIHDYPILTATYRWHGDRFINVTTSAPGPTEDRMTQDERTLLGLANSMRPAADEDDWITKEIVAVELLANANSLGLTDLPNAVTDTQGYQMGALWLSKNRQEGRSITQTIEAAKNPLPIFAGNAIND